MKLHSYKQGVYILALAFDTSYDTRNVLKRQEFIEIWALRFP